MPFPIQTPFRWYVGDFFFTTRFSPRRLLRLVGTSRRHLRHVVGSFFFITVVIAAAV